MAGIVGGAIGSSFMNYPDMGLMVVIAIMGGFIMAEISTMVNNQIPKQLKLLFALPFRQAHSNIPKTIDRALPFS